MKNYFSIRSMFFFGVLMLQSTTAFARHCERLEELDSLETMARQHCHFKAVVKTEHTVNDPEFWVDGKQVTEAETQTYPPESLHYITQYWSTNGPTNLKGTIALYPYRYNAPCLIYGSETNGKPYLLIYTENGYSPYITHYAYTIHEFKKVLADRFDLAIVAD